MDVGGVEIEARRQVSASSLSPMLAVCDSSAPPLRPTAQGLGLYWCNGLTGARTVVSNHAEARYKGHPHHVGLSEQHRDRACLAG